MAEGNADAATFEHYAELKKQLEQQVADWEKAMEDMPK